MLTKIAGEGTSAVYVDTRALLHHADLFIIWHITGCVGIGKSASSPFLHLIVSLVLKTKTI
jgi:hypothetical protein